MQNESEIKEIRKGLHDINDKLASVVMCCDTLLMDIKSEEQIKQYLRYSLDSAKKAGDIVYNIFRIINKLQEKSDPIS